MQNIINKLKYSKKQILKVTIIIISLPLIMFLFNTIVATIFNLGIFIGTFLRCVYNFVVC